MRTSKTNAFKNASIVKAVEMNYKSLEHHRQERLITHAEYMTEDFIKAAQTGYDKNNLDAPAHFAKPFKDLRTDDYIQPSIADVMAESLDYSNGPELKDVFMVFLKAAHEGDEKANVILRQMAATYARFSEEEV